MKAAFASLAALGLLVGISVTFRINRKRKAQRGPSRALARASAESPSLMEKHSGQTRYQHHEEAAHGGHADHSSHGPVKVTFYNCGNVFNFANEVPTANAYLPDTKQWSELEHTTCPGTLTKVKGGEWSLEIPESARKDIQNPLSRSSQDASSIWLGNKRVYEAPQPVGANPRKSFAILSDQAYPAFQSGPMSLSFESSGQAVHDSFQADFAGVGGIPKNMGWRWMCDEKADKLEGHDIQDLELDIQGLELHDSRGLPDRAEASQKAGMFIVQYKGGNSSRGSNSMNKCVKERLAASIVQPFCPRRIVSGPRYCVPWYVPIVSNTPVDQNIPDDLPLNLLQVMGTHNSCHRTTSAIESPTDSITFALTAPFQVDMLPLGEQLDRGVRQLELDLWFENQVPDWMSMHIAYWDPISLCNTLEECMSEVMQWSRNHPHHTPISVVLEVKGMTKTVYDLKNSKGVPPVKITRTNLSRPVCEQRDPNPLQLLEEKVRRLVGSEESIIKPKDVYWNGQWKKWIWPTVGKSRGKIYFILDFTGPSDFTNCIDPPSKKPAYKLDRNYNLFFVRFYYPDHFNPKPTYPDDGIPKVVELSGVIDHMVIRGLIAQGYMIRAHAFSSSNVTKDLSTLGNGYQAIKLDSPHKFAQLIVTDFPEVTELCCYRDGPKYGDPLEAKGMVPDAGCNIKDCVGSRMSAAAPVAFA